MTTSVHITLQELINIIVIIDYTHVYSSYQFNMKLRGSLLVIVCCLVVEFCNFNQKEYLLIISDLFFRCLDFALLGLLFLLYPLMGHLTVPDQIP